MTIEDFEYRLNIDYCGAFIDPETNKERSAICIRMYIYKEKGLEGKKLGINIDTEPSTDLDESIKELNKKFNGWLESRYETKDDIEGVLSANKDLKKKFENWVWINPVTLMQAKTIDVEVDA